MSIKLTNHLEGNFYQHKEFVLEQLSSSTGLPVVQGILYTNTADKGMYYFDGTNWKRIDNQSMSASDILAALLTVDGAGTGLDADKLDGNEGSHYLNRANHSGIQTASTISDLATVVKGYRLDEFAVPTNAISMNSQKITNLANPTSSTSNDAVPASWVTTAINNAVQGLDIKQSVRVISTDTINGTYNGTGGGGVGTYTLTGASSTHSSKFDGVTLAVNDRVLIKDGNPIVNNGFYKVTAITPNTVFERVDVTHGQNLLENAFAFVESGNTLRDTGWVLSSLVNNSNIVGTNGINVIQFSSAGVITAGTGLTKSGNEISIDTSVVARKFSATIGDNSTTTFTVTHSLGTQDVYVSVREASGGKEFVLADTAVTGDNTVSVTFLDAPSSGQYRVTVIG